MKALLVNEHLLNIIARNQIIQKALPQIKEAWLRRLGPSPLFRMNEASYFICMKYYIL